MKNQTLIVLLSLVCLSLLSCLSNVQGPSSAQKSYQEAGEMVTRQAPDSAMLKLQQAFAAGLPKPMQLVTDSKFYPLIDSPVYRPKVRELLQDYSIQDKAVMVRKEEPGLPIAITIKIVDESSGVPLPDVKAELVQADSSGYYFRETSTWNPRLFAYLCSDKNGTLKVQTIRPGSYSDDDDNPVPAHVHFTLKKDGYRNYGSEFTFADDPNIMKEGNIDNMPVATRQTSAKESSYKVTIAMQRL